MSQREEILAVQGFIVLANVDPHRVGEVLIAKSSGALFKITERAKFEDFQRQNVKFGGEDPADERFAAMRQRYRFFHKAVRL